MTANGQRMKYLGPLALPAVASPERIGNIDYSDWQENTSFGLPDDLAHFSWDFLVYEESLGPYVKALWMGDRPGLTLPWVRGRFWSDERSLMGHGSGQIVVTVLTYSRTQRFLVDPLPGESDYRYFTPVREAFLRVLRVLVRREHGLHTSYTPRFDGNRAAAAAAASAA